MEKNKNIDANAEPNVRDNGQKSRFEFEIDGHRALADYRIADGVMDLYHTESPPALAGRGVGSKLIRTALLSARAQGLKVRPTCSFVAAYLKRHPEFADIAE
jgi:predicted GNAT family acetyltransferase